MELKCTSCGHVHRADPGANVDAVAEILSAIKRAKMEKRISRRDMCDALRWCAEWLDVTQITEPADASLPTP